MKHYIIVKWLDDEIDKEALIPSIERLFQKTINISGIHKVEVIPNCIRRDNRYDLMIVLHMDEEALPVYDASDAHKEWKERYGNMIKSKAIFDSRE